MNCLRVIIGSPNLTETGLFGKKQNNIILTFDYSLPAPKNNQKAIQSFLGYFNDTKRECDLFMQDLVTLLDQEGMEPKVEENLIQRWLNESNEEVQIRQVKSFIKEFNDQVLENISEEEINFSIYLPQAKETQRAIEKILPIKHFERISDNKIIVSSLRYFRLIKESIQYPLMYIKSEEHERKVFLISDKPRSCTSCPKSSQEVDQALQNLEDFCNTVELGQTENPLRAKMIFYEAMLYFLNAPFSHELMKAKKQTVGIADDTGLQYLIICGLGANSKTQLIRFMLKVLTGQLIDPLPVEQFTAKKVEYISNLGTVFPIVVDDVRSAKLSAREDLFKNYWEKHWSTDIDCPQIIVTTNYRDILNKEWAVRRIKGLDFDVVFKKKQENSQRLNTIMAQSNPIFSYFSYYFLNRTDIIKHFKIEDELNIARLVMKELYTMAGRPLPKYFPERPAEEMFDKNWDKWRRSIQLGKMSIKYKSNTVQVIFPSDMRYEIIPHLKALPQELVAEVHGNMIVCDRKKEFRKWVDGSEKQISLWKNLFVSQP